jgi:deoxyribose-phosphate aldolase
MTLAHAAAVKSSKPAMERKLSQKELASHIDHTLLRMDTSKSDVERLCREALEHSFYAVCVPPYFVGVAKNLLRESKAKVATVVGFPMGYATINVKAEETRKAFVDGADEIDMVMNVAALKSGNLNHVRDDIQSIITLCRLNNKVSKIILETGLLTQEEIEKACAICVEAGADYVKTSTGFNGPGATTEVVELLRSLLPSKIKIKASGGIRTREDAERMIAAGASRLGTSAGLTIIAE